MWDYISERVTKEAEYIMRTGATVRACATYFGVSKSTVHKDVTERLEVINNALFIGVRAVLDKNLSERHIRGGIATKNKYSTRKNAACNGQNINRQTEQSSITTYSQPSDTQQTCMPERWSDGDKQAAQTGGRSTAGNVNASCIHNEVCAASIRNGKPCAANKNHAKGNANGNAKDGPYYCTKNCVNSSAKVCKNCLICACGLFLSCEKRPHISCGVCPKRPEK